MSDKIQMHESDYQKILRALENAYEYHWAQNQMNARLHLSERTIASPLTAELADAVRRMKLLMEQSK